MKDIEIVLGRRGEGKREKDGGVNLRYVASTYVNITMYPPVQLLYAIKIILKNEVWFLENLKLQMCVIRVAQFRSPLDSTALVSSSSCGIINRLRDFTK
jgi:hypothetical protein